VPSPGALPHDYDTVRRVIDHPLQQHAVHMVASLISILRSLKTAGDYYEFQRHLFAELAAVQGWQASASKNVKRQRRGRSAAPIVVEEWPIELIASNRIARQLRSVGDALAWRLFNFDRRSIMALSLNAAPSPIVHKEGLQYDLAEVDRIWRHERRFALLHDLTNCLRIADLTKFGGPVPEVIEVKKDPSRSDPRQLRRVQVALAMILKGGRQPEDEVLHIAHQKLVTHHGVLAEAIAQAGSAGISSVRVESEWGLTCLSQLRATSRTESQELLNEARTKTFRLAGLGEREDQHQLLTHSFDAVGKVPFFAPFTILPFTPDLCARLTCDAVAYESVLGWDRLAAAFQAEGFETASPLPRGSDPIPKGGPVIVIRRGGKAFWMGDVGFQQIALELIDLTAYAAATSEYVDAYETPQAGAFTFAAEGAVWR
jgi:hypothetical protein